MKISRLLLCMLVHLYSPLCQAQNSVPACPPTLNETPPATPPNTRWESMIYPGRTQPRLESMMLFDGHPREMASLVPDEDQSSSRGTTSIWHFQRTDPQRGIWVACVYTNTNAILTARLPDKLRQCIGAQGRNRAGQIAHVQSFSCE